MHICICAYCISMWQLAGTGMDHELSGRNHGGNTVCCHRQLYSSPASGGIWKDARLGSGGAQLERKGLSRGTAGCPSLVVLHVILYDKL